MNDRQNVLHHSRASNAFHLPILGLANAFHMAIIIRICCRSLFGGRPRILNKQHQIIGYGSLKSGFNMP